MNNYLHVYEIRIVAMLLATCLTGCEGTASDNGRYRTEVHEMWTADSYPDMTKRTPHLLLIDTRTGHVWRTNEEVWAHDKVSLGA